MISFCHLVHLFTPKTYTHFCGGGWNLRESSTLWGASISRVWTCPTTGKPSRWQRSICTQLISNLCLTNNICISSRTQNLIFRVLQGIRRKDRGEQAVRSLFCQFLFFFLHYLMNPPPKNNHDIIISLNPVRVGVSEPDTICHYVPEKIGQTNRVILLVNSSTCPDWDWGDSFSYSSGVLFGNRW